MSLSDMSLAQCVVAMAMMHRAITLQGIQMVALTALDVRRQKEQMQK